VAIALSGYGFYVQYRVVDTVSTIFNTSSVLADPTTNRMEITRWVPGVAMGVRHSGIVTGSGTFTLEPLAGGTRTTFTWAESLDYPWYLGGRLGAAVSGRLLLTPLWRRNLRRLQALVEAP